MLCFFYIACDVSITLAEQTSTIKEKLFADPAGAGYPKERAKSQAMSRQTLAGISKLSHKDFTDILKASDPEILKAIAGSKDFMKVLADGGEKAKAVLELLGENR